MRVDGVARPAYRLDAARLRSAGSVLGLYPCRLVAASQGGRWMLRHAASCRAVSPCLPTGPVLPQALKASNAPNASMSRPA